MYRKLVLLILLSVSIFAQNHKIDGIIRDKDTKEPLIGANILVDNHAKGAASDMDGAFFILMDNSSAVSLIISHIGYQTDTIRAVPGDKLEITLNSLTEELDAVEITADREDSHRMADGHLMGKDEIALRRESGLSSLGDMLTGMYGANLKVCCALDARSSLSLLGLPGAYTEITVDDAPEVCGLASSYRLYSYPVIGVEKMEIRKGAGNVMSEAKALGGHVNIKTRTPEPGPAQGSVAIYHRSVGGQELQAELSNKIGGIGASAAFSVSSGDEFDRDGDGWSEAPSSDRQFVRFKLSKGNSDKINGNISGLYLSELVTGGMTDVSREDIGDDPYWVRSVGTKRYESNAVLNIPVYNSNLRLSGTFAQVELDQVVGLENTSIEENGVVSEASYSMPFAHGELTSAVSYRYEEIDEHETTDGLDRTDDLMSFKIQDSREIIPNLNTNAGFRVDGKSGSDIDEREWSVFPRINLEYKPRFDLLLTASVGRGGRFRPSAQDLLEGYDEAIVVEVPNNLKGERGWTSQFGAEWKLFDDEAIYTLGGTAWYSNIDDRLLPYSTTGGVLTYTNATGATRIAGGDAQLQMDYANGILVHFGAEYNYTQFNNNGESAPLPFTPDWRAFGRFTWEDMAGIDGLKLWLTSTAYGPQSLPENAYGMDKSDPYITNDATLTFRTGAISFTAGVRNIFDVTQEISPLQGTADPFASGVSTELLYGPLVGRSYVASMVFYFGPSGKVLKGMGYGGMLDNHDGHDHNMMAEGHENCDHELENIEYISYNPSEHEDHSNCSHGDIDVKDSQIGKQLFNTQNEMDHDDHSNCSHGTMKIDVLHSSESSHEEHGESCSHSKGAGHEGCSKVSGEHECTHGEKSEGCSHSKGAGHEGCSKVSGEHECTHGEKGEGCSHNKGAGHEGCSKASGEHECTHSEKSEDCSHSKGAGHEGCSKASGEHECTHGEKGEGCSHSKGAGHEDCSHSNIESHEGCSHK